MSWDAESERESLRRLREAEIGDAIDQKMKAEAMREGGDETKAFIYELNAAEAHARAHIYGAICGATFSTREDLARLIERLEPLSEASADVSHYGRYVEEFRARRAKLLKKHRSGTS
jgi:hypothetical protein